MRTARQERRRPVEHVAAVGAPGLDVHEIDRARHDGARVAEHLVAGGLVGEVVGEHCSGRADLQVPAGRPVDTRERLDDRERLPEVQLASAVTRGQEHPQQPGVTQRGDGLVAEAPIDLGLVGFAAHDVGDVVDPLEVLLLAAHRHVPSLKR